MQVSGSLTRVQSLAQSGLSQVPPQFIQSPNKRPINHNPRAAASPSEADVPVIDLFGFDPEKRESVREAIGKACREWGLFFVTNPGIPISLLDDIRRVGLTFFQDSPMSEKLRYACDPSSAATEGYGTRMLQNDGGHTLDWRDYFDHHTFPLSRRNPSRWPDFPHDYREVVAKFSDEMKVLAQKLMGLISESLGMKTSCIEDAVGDIYQNVAFSYYPPCPQPELTLGLQSHSDIGALTLLVQDDVAGLQTLKDGDKWVTVKPLPQAVLAILGDQTEIISNGKYRSSEHRAITNSDKPRFSVATFHDPPKTVKISPAYELLGESSPPKYRGVVYGDYISTWYTKGPEGKRNIDALLLDS